MTAILDCGMWSDCTILSHSVLLIKFDQIANSLTNAKLYTSK